MLTCFLGLISDTGAEEHKLIVSALVSSEVRHRTSRSRRAGQHDFTGGIQFRLIHGAVGSCNESVG
jgi:hypothetical protein